ncbi:putative fibroblast growth factor 1 isoform X2 [Xenia sp. Carnegie-2017]|uniref:putative fibroblast growth factor 1 isoform X2 n=1 Tax=Xenia sp. Carnegie-2017 TaxID=2897299 RepID=UPI001F03BC17|nr:putative fibroblast growth factor 1 isoform X2 [Xenia sp. Carnegie-2017]
METKDDVSEMGLLWSIFITFQMSFALLSERFYVKCDVRTAEKHWSFFKYPFHHPTNRKKVALMCHNKNYLVLMNGKLKGSVDPKIIRKYGKFELQTFGVGKVRIFNVRGKKFVAVDKKGRAYITRNNTLDALFVTTQKNSLFVTYHSYKHKTHTLNGSQKWYLAIKKDGRLKRPSKTHLRQRSTEFLQRDWRKYKQQLTGSFQK